MPGTSCCLVIVENCKGSLHSLSQRAPADPLRKEIEIWKKSLHNFDLAHMGGDQQDRVRLKLILYIAELEARLKKKLEAEAALESALEGGGHSSGSSHQHAPSPSSESQKGKEKQREDTAVHPGSDDEEKVLIASDSENGDPVLGHSRDGKEFSESSNDPAPAGAVDISAMERKYVISDDTLFIKSCCVLVVVIILFFLHSFLSTLTSIASYMCLSDAYFVYSGNQIVAALDRHSWSPRASCVIGSRQLSRDIGERYVTLLLTLTLKGS